jgi:hypothetical protein
VQAGGTRQVPGDRPRTCKTMNPRFLAAGVVAIASLTLSTAQAAAPTQIVYQRPSVMELNTPATLTAYVLSDDESRVEAPTLTFKLGSKTVTGPGKPGSSVTTATLSPNQLGLAQPLEIRYAGNALYDPATLVTPVDVWEYVFDDLNSTTMLMINPSRNELRVTGSTYDSGVVTGFQVTPAGPAVVFNVDTTDANGDRLVLAGTFYPARHAFAAAGVAGGPVVLGNSA